MNDMESLFKNLDKSTLDKIKNLVSSDQGKNLMNQLSGMDKDALLKKAKSLTDEQKNEIINKLKGLK